MINPQGLSGAATKKVIKEMVYHIVGLGRDKHKRNMTNELSMAEYMQEKTIKMLEK